MNEIIKSLCVNLVEERDELVLEVPRDLWMSYGLTEETKPIFIQNENGFIIVLNKEEAEGEVTVNSGQLESEEKVETEMIETSIESEELTKEGP